MLISPGSFKTTKIACCVAGAVMACLGAIACSGDSPTDPSGSGGSGNSGTGSSTSCRTSASSSRSVQTFATGQVVATNTQCVPGTTDVTCSQDFTDSSGGPGSGVQTTRWSARGDIIDEVAVIPPLTRALNTTTTTTVAGFTLTITATHSYDSQKRLVSTQVVSTASGVQITSSTVTFTTWDSAGRPTTATGSPNGSETLTYDNTNRTVTHAGGLNRCVQTYDQNGNITREECTGTTPSTTVVTVLASQQICR